MEVPRPLFGEGPLPLDAMRAQQAALPTTRAIPTHVAYDPANQKLWVHPLPKGEFQFEVLWKEKDWGKLNDPAYIAAQARERLGFVKPGDIPFQVQLPPGAATAAQPGGDAAKPANNDPWYTSLWHTIADAPHLPPAANPSPAPTPPGG